MFAFEGSSGGKHRFSVCRRADASQACPAAHRQDAVSPGSLSPSSVSARAGPALGSPRFSWASPHLFSSETLSGRRGGGVHSHPHFIEGDTEAQRGEGAQPPTAPSDLGAPARPAGMPFPRLRGCGRRDSVKRKHFGFPAGSGVPGSRWGAGEMGAPLAFHLEPEVPPCRPPWGPPHHPPGAINRLLLRPTCCPAGMPGPKTGRGPPPTPRRKRCPPRAAPCQASEAP